MKKWTQKEKDMLLDYIWSDDSDTLDQSIEFAIYKLHYESGFDFPERTLKAAKSMYYKETNKQRQEALVRGQN